MYVMATDDRISVDRGKAIEAALSGIEKRFGKGSIMRLGEREVSDVPAISTTSISLDAAVGIGGVPRGRIIEIYGPESSGKTTLLCIRGEAQKPLVAAYMMPNTPWRRLTPQTWVDIDNCLFPAGSEQALEIAGRWYAQRRLLIVLILSRLVPGRT